MTEFLTEWWPAVAAILLAVVKMLNTISKHWTEQSGILKKVAGFIVEVLDLFRVPEVKGPKSADDTE